MADAIAADTMIDLHAEFSAAGWSSISRRLRKIWSA
jgi:hypothetical protein